MSNQYQKETGSTENWDVAIVGAGAVGILMAVKLARSGKKVLLLESGQHQETKSAYELNDAVQIGRLHTGICEGRARVVGGTTTLWGGQLTYFSPSDFEKKIQGDKLWPINFENLDSYYREAAQLLGLDARYLSDTEIKAKKLGDEQLNLSDCEVFYTRWLKEPNFARLFKDELADKTKINLITDSHVRKINISEDKKKVSSLVTCNSKGDVKEYFASTFVLANGTIEISRLLLLSAKSNKNAPWASNCFIGKYFQDHIDVKIGRIPNDSCERVVKAFENIVIDGYKYQPKVKVNNKAMATTNVLNIASSMQFESKYTDDIALIKHFVRSVRNGVFDAGLSWRSLLGLLFKIQLWLPIAWRYIKHRRIMAFADGGISVIVHCEQDVNRDSRITLDQNRSDRFGDSLACLDWQIDESAVVNSIRIYCDQLKEFLHTVFQADFMIDKWVQAADSLPDSARDSYHQCGGTRMSVDADCGVVDTNCLVHGTSNLYVAGAAVFPSSSFANPTFTAMALGLRSADSLLKGKSV